MDNFLFSKELSNKCRFKWLVTTMHTHIKLLEEMVAHKIKINSESNANKLVLKHSPMFLVVSREQ